MNRHAPIITVEEAKHWMSRRRRRKMKITLADGDFDVMDVDHVTYLEAAARLADELLVVVFSDQAVDYLYGKGRPLIPQAERAKLVSALGNVDRVLITDNLDVAELIQELKPDYLAKFSEHHADNEQEKDVARAVGTQWVVCGQYTDNACTALLEKLGHSRLSIAERERESQGE